MKSSDQSPDCESLLARAGDVSAFVRGFVTDESCAGSELAALHGSAAGFRGPLSDVDLVVSKEGFPLVARKVADYASRMGWRLCQVIRHESTAVFCVVSWLKDPRVAVALDICSDYRRDERVLMVAAELLEGRERLDSGGFRVSRENELRYRFLKAAVKGKDPSVAGAALAAFPERERGEVRAWLSDRWGVNLVGWDAGGLESAWKELGRRTLREGRSGGVAGWRRVGRRLVQPTGLVVEGMDAGQRARVIEVFERLYFRRVVVADRFQPRHFKALACSTLLACDRVGPMSRVLLGRALRVVAGGSEDAGALVARIAGHLADRCARREGLASEG